MMLTIMTTMMSGSLLQFSFLLTFPLGVFMWTAVVMTSCFPSCWCCGFPVQGKLNGCGWVHSQVLSQQATKRQTMCPGGNQAHHELLPCTEDRTASLPIKKDSMRQFNWQVLIASQAMLSLTDAGQHEEGVWGSGFWLWMCWQVGRDWGNSMV